MTGQGAGTVLRVVETGFTGLALPPVEQAAQYRDNTEGWQAELDELREYVERA